jgi:hypothetical protein
VGTIQFCSNEAVFRRQARVENGGIVKHFIYEK